MSVVSSPCLWVPWQQPELQTEASILSKDSKAQTLPENACYLMALKVTVMELHGVRWEGPKAPASSVGSSGLGSLSGHGAHIGLPTRILIQDINHSQTQGELSFQLSQYPWRWGWSHSVTNVLGFHMS